MSEPTGGIRNWTTLIAIAVLVAFGGLALAQETEPGNDATENDGLGPPWLRPDFEGTWTPGTPGPPPWAGQDDDDDGLGPPWLRPDFEGTWTPGTPGPPPWAGQDDD